jgi:PAS domain S-box-containing protein
MTDGSSHDVNARIATESAAEARERQAASRRHNEGDASVKRKPRPVGLAGVAAEHLFTALCENVRDYAVFLMDADGIIRYWGEGARLMKWWTREQAEGRHLRMLYPDGGAEDGTAESHLQMAAARGEYTGEGHRVRSDGSTFLAGITLTALKDHNDTLLGFVKVTRDVSARRAVETTLSAAQGAEERQRVAEQANRLKSLFISSVTHELRGPLNAMLGNLDLLERVTPADAPQRPVVSRVLNSGRHLLQIVEDVLDVSRIEAGRMPVRSVAGRLGPPIVAALADSEAEARAKGITLTNSVSGSAMELPYWGDDTRVRQIISNLLTNAVKFTPVGGEVTVSAGTADTASDAALMGEGPWAYVRVEDTGVGIPADRMTTIFEPYGQARLSDATHGTGLGLSIARRLARLMGGDVTARSTVGVGSQFVLWLPVDASSPPVPR